jgi:hypothetical protein
MSGIETNSGPYRADLWGVSLPRALPWAGVWLPRWGEFELDRNLKSLRFRLVKDFFANLMDHESL